MASHFFHTCLYYAYGAFETIFNMGDQQHYHGVIINRYAPAIMHLMFGDNPFLFGKHKMEMSKNTKQILATYKRRLTLKNL